MLALSFYSKRLEIKLPKRVSNGLCPADKNLIEWMFLTEGSLMTHDAMHLCALYRNALRQTRRLPHSYLQLFFRLKFGDDIRVINATKDSSRYAQRVKRFEKVCAFRAK
jgi:hypothetical protein